MFIGDIYFALSLHFGSGMDLISFRNCSLMVL